MKSRIIKADYYPETGLSILTKTSKYGTFTATAAVDSDDEDIANRWDGLAFAEYKVDTMIAKEKTDRLRERMIGIENAIKCIVPPNRDEYDYTYEKLMVQYHDAKSRYFESKNKYDRMKRNYRKKVDEILKYRRHVRKFASNKNED